MASNDHDDHHQAIKARLELIRRVLEYVAVNDYSDATSLNWHASVEHLEEQLDLGARELAQAVAALPANERPVGWDAPQQWQPAAAMRWDGNNTSEVIDWVIGSGRRGANWHGATEHREQPEACHCPGLPWPRPEHIVLRTEAGGIVRAQIGDWVVRDTGGNHHVADQAAFRYAPEPVAVGGHE